MSRRQPILSALLMSLAALPVAAQETPTEAELAVRAASPGVIVNEETGDYTAIELELQGCRLVQTLLTNQGADIGGPVGVQVLRMDLRDLDPLTGILPGENTASGHQRMMLVPSQAAWEDIQAAGEVFSQMRQEATALGDEDTPDAVIGARTIHALRTQRHKILELNERVQLQRAQAIEATRTRTVGQLAGGVAHDFNQPLTVLDNMAIGRNLQ